MLAMYGKFRNSHMMSLVIVFVRFLIGFAFIPSGLTKLLGERFTLISIDEPIGFFFEAMYQTGIYWQFLGFVQLLAGFLLITQRFATLGAVVFFGIIVNIWLITVGLHFQGTWIITSLMLLASLLLLVWDWDKLQVFWARDGEWFNSKHYLQISPIWQYTGLIFYGIVLVAIIAGGMLKDYPRDVLAVIYLSVCFFICGLMLYALVKDIRAYRKSKALDKLSQ